MTESEIRNNLDLMVCPNGACGAIALCVVKKLIGQQFENIHFDKCVSFDEALSAIGKIFPEHQLVPIWPQWGFSNGNPVKHFLMIYSINPLNSFSLFPNGISFFSKEETEDRIRSTTSSQAWGGYIDVNRIKQTTISA